MEPLVHYGTVADARSNLKGVLDSAEAGTPTTVRREAKRFAVVDAERLRTYLSSVGTRATVVAEDGGWSLFFPGLPIAASGDTLDELLMDAVAVLREYAEDWVERLHLAPNHANNWALVQLVALSNDEQIRDWLQGSAS